MYTHLLLPTDGSALSRKAVEAGIRLAKTFGARVTVFHAEPEFRTFTTQAEMLEDTRDEYLKHARKNAEECFDDARALAVKAGVVFDTEFVVDDDVHSSIIAAARKHGCDLIAMASHGRRGAQALLLGSETQKVLTHSDIPVLVYR